MYPWLAQNLQQTLGWSWTHRDLLTCASRVPGAGITLGKAIILKTSRAVVAHAFNSSTREAEPGGSLWVRDQPGLQELVPGQVPKLHRNPVSKKEKKTHNQHKFVFPTLKKKKKSASEVSKTFIHCTVFGSFLFYVITVTDLSSILRNHPLSHTHIIHTVGMEGRLSPK